MKKIRVKQVRSVIGCLNSHRRIVASLGLKKINHIKELPDCPEVRGQIKKVDYLVSIVE
jgi:large subunit ribosomal protein L30